METVGIKDIKNNLSRYFREHFTAEVPAKWEAAENAVECIEQTTPLPISASLIEAGY